MTRSPDGSAAGGAAVDRAGKITRDIVLATLDNPDETDVLLRLGLHRLPIGEFPLLRSLASVPVSYDGTAELERGLDILLAGLASHRPNDAVTPVAR
ncbi:MAG TPA: hypothetical protein VNF47_15585 [Streptosporangiaceae bacterium]|nr:hypothetical protein [Streptosporangiaceae bacterium]